MVVYKSSKESSHGNETCAKAENSFLKHPMLWLSEKWLYFGIQFNFTLCTSYVYMHIDNMWFYINKKHNFSSKMKTAVSSFYQSINVKMLFFTRKMNFLSTKKLSVFTQAKQKWRKKVKRQRDYVYQVFSLSLGFMVFRKTFQRKSL